MVNNVLRSFPFHHYCLCLSLPPDLNFERTSLPLLLGDLLGLLGLLGALLGTLLGNLLGALLGNLPLDDFLHLLGLGLEGANALLVGQHKARDGATALLVAVSGLLAILLALGR